MVRFWETVSAEASLRGTNDSVPTIRGPRSRASPIVTTGVGLGGENWDAVRQCMIVGAVHQ